MVRYSASVQNVVSEHLAWHLPTLILTFPHQSEHCISDFHHLEEALQVIQYGSNWEDSFCGQHRYNRTFNFVITYTSLSMTETSCVPVVCFGGIKEKSRGKEKIALCMALQNGYHESVAVGGRQPLWRLKIMTSTMKTSTTGG